MSGRKPLFPFLPEEENQGYSQSDSLGSGQSVSGQMSGTSESAECTRRPSMEVCVYCDCLDVPGLIEYTFQGPDLEEWLTNREVDHVKKNVQRWLKEEFDFPILRRHFQVEVWLTTVNRWERVPYDSTIGQIVELHQLSRRQSHWLFQIKLNDGVTSENCGDAVVNRYGPSVYV